MTAATIRLYPRTKHESVELNNQRAIDSEMLEVSPSQWVFTRSVGVGRGTEGFATLGFSFLTIKSMRS